MIKKLFFLGFFTFVFSLFFSTSVFAVDTPVTDLLPMTETSPYAAFLDDAEAANSTFNQETSSWLVAKGGDQGYYGGDFALYWTNDTAGLKLWNQEAGRIVFVYQCTSGNSGYFAIYSSSVSVINDYNCPGSSRGYGISNTGNIDHITAWHLIDDSTNANNIMPYKMPILTPPVVYPEIHSASFNGAAKGLTVDFSGVAVAGELLDTEITDWLWKFEGENDDFTDTSSSIVAHCNNGCFYSVETSYTFPQAGIYTTYMTVRDEHFESKTIMQTFTLVDDDKSHLIYATSLPDDIPCDDSNVFNNVMCNLGKQIDVGVLNPSINAFKGIFSAMVVPAEPECGFTIPDIEIMSGKTYPLSDLAVGICNQSEVLHEAFPLASTIVNFLMAITLLGLIIAIINKLLNHNDTDIFPTIDDVWEEGGPKHSLTMNSGKHWRDK